MVSRVASKTLLTVQIMESRSSLGSLFDINCRVATHGAKIRTIPKDDQIKCDQKTHSLYSTAVGKLFWMSQLRDDINKWFIDHSVIGQRLLSNSRTQASASHSSAEAELYAMTQASIESWAIKHFVRRLDGPAIRNANRGDSRESIRANWFAEGTLFSERSSNSLESPQTCDSRCSSALKRNSQKGVQFRNCESIRANQAI